MPVYYWIVVGFLLIFGIPLALNLSAWKKDKALAYQLRTENPDLQTFPLIPADSPLISFLVAAWQEKRLIRRCIDSILSLPYPNLELVLCAGGPDGTYQEAAGYSDKRLILLEQGAGEGKQHALQRCLEAATGEIIYLTDGDCMISPGTFTVGVLPILEGREEVVTGNFYFPLPEQSMNIFVLSQVTSRAYAAAHAPAYSNGLLGGNCIMRRETLEQAGEFRTDVRSGTDYDLALRLRKAGKRIRYEVFSSIESEFPTSISAYIRQNRRWIRNLVLHGSLHHDNNLVISSISSSLLGLLMLSIPVIGIMFILQSNTTGVVGLALTVTWCSLFVYGLFSRIRYQMFSRIWPGLDFPFCFYLLLPFFMLVDFITWTAPLLDYLFRSRRAHW